MFRCCCGALLHSNVWYTRGSPRKDGKHPPQNTCIATTSCITKSPTQSRIAGQSTLVSLCLYIVALNSLEGEVTRRIRRLNCLFRGQLSAEGLLAEVGDVFMTAGIPCVRPPVFLLLKVCSWLLVRLCQKPYHLPAPFSNIVV